MEGPEDEWALRLCEESSLRLRRSTASMDVVRRQSMTSLCDRVGDVYHALHEHLSELTYRYRRAWLHVQKMFLFRSGDV